MSPRPRRFAFSSRGEALRMEPVNPLEAAVAQASGLEHVAHRPYPLPGGRWVMGQSWFELLFAHWPVPVEVLRPHVPESLEVDAFDGSGWLGITPFRIEALRIRGVPPPPFVSSFRELNVRTYVNRDGRPGIWFFSLDASSRVAVRAARRLYRLPYFHALIEWRNEDDRIHFRSTRQEGRPARFDAEYRPVGDAFHAEPGTLEHFLVERYCLYAQHAGRVYRAEIHHPPWPLQAAEADVAAETMPPPEIALPAQAPLVHFSARIDVVVWRSRAIARGRSRK
jgi:uncharacterized protein